MSGLECPLFVDAEAQPVGVMRVERVFTDYERHGFFRIGALPVLVLETTTLELFRLAQAGEALAKAQDWLRSKAAGRVVDCRNLTIVIPGSVTNVVRAGLAKIAADGQLELTENVRVDGLLPLQARLARLQMSGPNCGELTWEAQDGTAMKYNLFQGFGMKKASPGTGL